MNHRLTFETTARRAQWLNAIVMGSTSKANGQEHNARVAIVCRVSSEKVRWSSESSERSCRVQTAKMTRGDGRMRSLAANSILIR